MCPSGDLWTMNEDGRRLSRRQLLTGAGLAAVGSLAVGPRVLAADPDYERPGDGWPTAGRTPARTGFVPVRDGVAALDPASGDELARTATGLTVDDGDALALDGDRLYLAADDPLTVVALSYA